RLAALPLRRPGAPHARALHRAPARRQLAVGRLSRRRTRRCDPTDHRGGPPLPAAQTAAETASAPPDAAIVVRGLTETFGATRALHGPDLTVPRGEVTGFLGPNGAGKSTTIRILLGLLRATSGRADVLGMDPWAQAVQIHHRLAYVPGDTNLWPNLTGGEAIDVLTRGER